MKADQACSKINWVHMQMHIPRGTMLSISHLLVACNIACSKTCSAAEIQLEQVLDQDFICWNNTVALTYITASFV